MVGKKGDRNMNIGDKFSIKKTQWVVLGVRDYDSVIVARDSNDVVGSFSIEEILTERIFLLQSCLYRISSETQLTEEFSLLIDELLHNE